jgi:hypothetical protein
MGQTTSQDQEVLDLLNEVTDSLMRLYVQQKHVFGAEDRYGSLNDIMNIAYRIHWAQQKLAMNQNVPVKGLRTTPGQLAKPSEQSVLSIAGDKAGR